MNHTWRRLLLISWGAAATLAGCTATLEGGAEGGEEYEAESHKGTCAKLKRRCEYGQATACEVWTRLCAPASKSDASKHPDASRADYDGIAKDGGTDATPDAAPSPPPSTNVLYVDGTLTSNCQSNYSVAARKCSGSDGAAYTTLSAGMNAMKAGYTLAIRGGTYRTALVVTKSGTPTAPIRITAYNKESVVIDMSGTTWTDAIAVDAKQWIEISGLTTWNASEFGIWVNNSSNIKVSNCDVSYSQHGGVVFQSASNISVRDCAVHHNNQVGLSAAHEAITFENVDTFEVVNCDVYDNKEEGINAKYNSSNGIIAYNRSYRNNGPNIYIDAARSITVVGNMCYDTASSSKTCIGVSVESEWNPNHYPTKDLKIINNVIWGSGGGIWLWTESPNESWSVLSNVRIEYNTIVDNAKNSWGGILFMNGSSSNFSGTNTIRNNIIIGNGGYGIISSNGSILAKFAIANNLFQSGESSTTTGTGAVSTSTSPFVNRTGKNFKLASGAAARGMGLAISDVTTDIDGKARPSSATDVGAYQY